MATHTPIPEELHSLIAAQPLFEPLPEEALAELIAEGQLMRFDSGESMIEENTSNEVLFLLLKGTATAIISETPVGRLEPGDIAGEISTAGISPPIASVVAETDVEAVAFPVDAVARIAETDAGFGKRLRDAAFRRVSG